MGGLSVSQRVFLATGSACLGLLNPYRADLIAILAETTSDCALTSIRGKMLDTKEGALLLKEKPRITKDTVDLYRLDLLPEGTFGKAYARFMLSRGFTVDSRKPIGLMHDTELAYILQRYREVHDLWHVLLGLPTSVLGEIAQKYFEFLQTGLPMCGLSAGVGPIRLSFTDRTTLITKYIPWTYACNQSASFLLSKHLEKKFEQDLERVRTDLGIIPAPNV